MSTYKIFSSPELIYNTKEKIHMNNHAKVVLI